MVLEKMQLLQKQFQTLIKNFSEEFNTPISIRISGKLCRKQNQK